MLSAAEFVVQCVIRSTANEVFFLLVKLLIPFYKPIISFSWSISENKGEKIFYSKCPHLSELELENLKELSLQR